MLAVSADYGFLDDINPNIKDGSSHPPPLVSTKLM
jgi:hypothetical protein